VATTGLVVVLELEVHADQVTGSVVVVFLEAEAVVLELDHAFQASSRL